MAGPRFGIVGSGPWAETVHLPAAASSRRVSFAALYGRDTTRLATLVEGTTAVAYNDFEAFLGAVDIVGFAVPPSVQAHLARSGMTAGKHLLLEKPVSTEADVAAQLATEASDRNLHSIVFFPHRLDPGISAWATEQRNAGGWVVGRADSWSSTLSDEANPFHRSPWRHEQGSLWDSGPHLVAQLCAVLGKATSVFAQRGPGDLFLAVLEHEHGARSSIATAADLPPPPPSGTGTYFVGSGGKAVQPAVGDWTAMAREAYTSALSQLADQVEYGAESHPSDLRFGAHVTAVLAAAEQSARTGLVGTVR